MARGADDEHDGGGASLSADEDAIRAQLREGGWRKKTAKEATEESAEAATGETRRRENRRRTSKSRSRSASRERHRSSRRRHSGSSRSHRRSRSRESSSRRSARGSKRGEEKEDATDTDTEVADEHQRAEKEKNGGVEDMDVDEAAAEDAKPLKTERSKEKERGSPAARKSRRSSRHSRSRSGSHSRSSRRSRRHRSRSRSPSRSRRRRGSSRSRSRSRGRRSDRSRRRRRSRTPSRSRSSSRRRHRRSSSKEKRHEPEHAPPQSVPSVAPVAPPPQPAPAAGVSPSITQLMQQHPTLSLQEIITKMQASSATMAAAAAQKPARELYVGNLPPNVTGPQLQEFLSTIIQQVGLTTQPGNPIANTWMSTDGHFAFCEMRTVEECTLALLLNQLPLLGQPLKFGRPRSYMGPPQPLPIIPERAQTALVHLGCSPNPAYFSMTSLGLGGTTTSALPVPSVAATTPVAVQAAAAPVSTLPAAALVALPADPSSNRLLMSNIPVVLVESQVRELVEPFGTLKSFALLKDSATDASTGTALFEYELESVTDEALQGLNGLDIGGIPLSVRRAPQDANAAVEETSDVVKLVRWLVGALLRCGGLTTRLLSPLLLVCVCMLMLCDTG